MKFYCVANQWSKLSSTTRTSNYKSMSLIHITCQFISSITYVWGIYQIIPDVGLNLDETYVKCKSTMDDVAALAFSGTATSLAGAAGRLRWFSGDFVMTACAMESLGPTHVLVKFEALCWLTVISYESDFRISILDMKNSQSLKVCRWQRAVFSIEICKACHTNMEQITGHFLSRPCQHDLVNIVFGGWTVCRDPRECPRELGIFILFYFYISSITICIYIHIILVHEIQWTPAKIRGRWWR